MHPVQGKVKDKYKYKFKYRDYSGCWCTQGNVKDVQVQSWKICANKQADQVDKPQVGLQLVFYAILYNYQNQNPYNCNFFMQLFSVTAAVWQIFFLYSAFRRMDFSIFDSIIEVKVK